MSKRPREEEEEAGPSKTPEEEEEEGIAAALAGPSHTMGGGLYHGQYEAPHSHQPLTGQEPSTSGASSSQQQYLVPHPPLRVKRPGRPRIHPPKPFGISKPRGRPRGSKNKKPRKRRDTSSLVERPPKRPRGRPRKWPPEMWEGFQRSQFAAATQLQRQQRHQPQEMPGPSHYYYEEHVPPQLLPQEEIPSTVPALSHLPFHMVSQQDPQEISHLMTLPQQHQIPQHHHHHRQQQQQMQDPQQQLHLHHPIHPPPPHQHPPHHMHRQHEEQMLLLPPLYLQEQEQQQREQEMLLSQQQQQHQQQQQPQQQRQQQEQHRVYYHEQMQPPHHPPHTTS